MGLPRAEAARNVRRGLDKGLASPRPPSSWGTIKTSDDARTFWLDWHESIDPAAPEFSGTKGSSLLRMFATFFINGIAVGKRDLDFGVRQAALASGMSTNTATNMLKKGGAVESSGYMKAVARAPHGERKATTWRPILRNRSAENRDTLMPTHGAKAPCVAQNSVSGGPAELGDANVFHNRLNAWRIHLWVPRTPSAAPELDFDVNA
jgi:hypothetical protein